MLALYLRDVIPFRHMINPETPRDGFLFADKDKPTYSITAPEV
jgi:hypothetical protein